jgi:ketosteroid isomerase-like protein
MNEEIIKAIRDADARRCAATIAKDAAALDELFADDLVIVHAGGVAENKARYITRLCKSAYHYHGLTYIRRRFRVYGNAVLVNGDLRLEVTTPGGEKTLVVRYLQVWAGHNGRWQMVAWQSTPRRARAERVAGP